MKKIVTSFAAANVILGTAYLNEQQLEIEKLEALLDLQVKENALTKLAGFYAVFSDTQYKTYFAVDRVRSIPLFYANTEQALFVSDSFDWISEQLIFSESAEAKSEFLLTGYVCGADTLHPDIKQVEAGQLISFCKRSSELTKQDYFLFTHVEPQNFDPVALRDEFYQCVEQVFQRLVNHANGRQIVLPLSGGFDSRLIASSLKKLNYDNIVCFSYGVKGNKEAALSEQIANSLGFEWHFIEYTDQKWQTAWFSDQAQMFQRMASQGASLPHIQDWLAILELKKHKLVEDTAIFVPGHSGDFVAGSHIPDVVFEQTQFTTQKLIDELINNHFVSVPRLSANSYADDVLLEKRIQSTFPVKFEHDAISFANVYECWDWRERQAKYIINSVRAYEFFGYDWWLPLWDQAFVSFWCKVPLQLRRKRLWYNGCVAAIFEGQAPSFVELGNKNAAKFSFTRQLAHRVYDFLPMPLQKRVYAKKLRRDFDSHFLNFGALLCERQKEEFAQYGYTVIGAYNRLFLEKRWGKDEQ